MGKAARVRDIGGLRKTGDRKSTKPD